MYMQIIQYHWVLMHSDIPRFSDDHIQGNFGRINNVYIDSVFMWLCHMDNIEAIKKQYA